MNAARTSAYATSALLLLALELGLIRGFRPALGQFFDQFTCPLSVVFRDAHLKGQVRHGALDVGVGIEFREIRKGDRSLLQYILRKLAEQEQEEPAKTRVASASS